MLWSKKKEDDCYFQPEILFCRYFEREKSGFLLFGDQKNSSELFGESKIIMTAI